MVKSNSLDRNRALPEKWYKLFVERIPLLIPKAEKPRDSSLEIGDVVLFQDPGTPKMWTWKLGIIHSQLSRSTFEIRYVLNPSTGHKFICRDLHHICLMDELPPMSRLFYEQTETISDPAVSEHRSLNSAELV
jgi:hypothetical protein